MLRVDVKEQRVVDVELRDRVRAGRDEAQHRKRPVVMFVYQQPGHSRWTGRRSRPQCEARQRIRGDGGVARPYLAPADLAIPIGI